MTISEKVLAIAKAEWPNLQWHISTTKHVKPGAVQGYDEDVSKLFDPLNNFNDLIPLVVRYGIDMDFISTQEFHDDGFVDGFRYIVASHPGGIYVEGEYDDLSETEYCRVGVSALYQLICKGEA